MPYRSFKLKTRDLLPSGKLLLIKSLELYIAIKKHLKNYDYVFAHEEYTYLFPLLSKISKCVWDLHEIPFRFESRIMKLFFHYIERKSKRIHHANPYRIEYLNSNKTIKYPRKHVVVRNFPDQRFILAKETDGEYSRFTKWLGGNAYVYLQGLSNPMRYPINTILSIMNSCDLKAIVVGRFDRMAKMKLIETFSEQKLRERIFFRGHGRPAAHTCICERMLRSVLYYTIRKRPTIVIANPTGCISRLPWECRLSLDATNL